tara:strand:- start:2572 stop:3603 length:1032 start_codon:yes stop_codon:yes gene_type:complete
MADNTVVQTNVSDLPQWAKDEYMTGPKGVLSQAQALYGSNLAMPLYDGDRNAPNQALQSQAWGNAATMGVDPSTGQAASMAGAAGYNAGNLSYDPYQVGQFTGQTAGNYMNPYMQNVVDIQQREAGRASDIQRNVNQAQAVGQGAFGGSRSAIVEAERQRNLGTQLGDIQAQGLNAAYNQAQQQFNTENQLGEQSRQYGAGLGLQGLQTQAQAAGQLGLIGNQAYTQQMGINQLQSQYGGQQQALQQQDYDRKYQDFLNQQNYPQQQLTNYANILGQGLRGVGTSSTQTLTPPPSTMQNIGTLGMSAAGIGSLLKARGGYVGYASGGMVGSGGLGAIALNTLV